MNEMKSGIGTIGIFECGTIELFSENTIGLWQQIRVIRDIRMHL